MRLSCRQSSPVGRIMAAVSLGAIAIAAQPALTLVESAPIETTLDQPDLPATHAVWLDMIEGAQREIALAHFYASDRDGSELNRVVTALLAAAERGVHVRFLGDAGMARRYPETLDHLAATAGIDVRRYDMQARTHGVHHAKYLVVDGEDVCVGSANFDWRSMTHIQELGVRLRASALGAVFLAVFDLDWQLAAGGSPPPEATRGGVPTPIAATWGETPVRVTPLFSPRDLLPASAAWDLPQLLAAIDGAQRRILVQLLSYRADDWNPAERSLDEALRAAAARGVEVRVLVADWSKRAGSLQALQALQRVPGVDVRFVTIPPASTGFVPFARVVHTKCLVVDDRIAWIGTSNWSSDYFYESRNAGVLIEGAALAQRVARFVESTWDSSYTADVDPDAHYAPPQVDVPPTEPSATMALDQDGRWPAPRELLEIVRVVDGDTLHVRRGTEVVKLRLLSVDTEEKSYANASPTAAPASPNKPFTRYGNDTAAWAAKFFAERATVDGVMRIGLLQPNGVAELDRYGRLLCHVLLPDGTDYNLLLVREGRSPYFNKYGNSTLCHGAFVAAQEQARRAGRGIWDLRSNGGAPGRPYDQLLPWWNARAAAIDAFRAAHARDPETTLSVEDAAGLRGAAARGHTVALFGSIEAIAAQPDGGLHVVFRAPAGQPRVRAIVPANAVQGITALDLAATMAELHQNYLWLEGRLVSAPDGFTVAAGEASQWRLLR